MKAIVAVDNNWGIGYDGELLFHIKDDMKKFKYLTTNKVVVMGRKTFESIPYDMRPLKDRINIVMSQSKIHIDGVKVVHNDNELKAELCKYYPDDVYLIGGESLYNKYIDECTEAIVTKVKQNKKADRFFPNLDERPEWIWVNKSEFCAIEKGEKYLYDYIKYINVNLNSKGLRLNTNFDTTII